MYRALRKYMKYNLTAQMTISIYTEVEADSLEEAIEIAKDRDYMSIVKNGGDSEEDFWMCDELDGYPKNITEE